MLNKIEEETKKETAFRPKVLFYVGNPYVFRTALIGHLYEISQAYPTILLSEKLDLETEEVLRKKELFPKLEKIIPALQFTGKKTNLFSLNRYLCKLAKSVIQQYNPDIVVVPSDLILFELYLMRFAKKAGALKISIQSSNNLGSIRAAKWTDLINSYLRFPLLFPFWLRLFFTKCRKYFGHILYYFILPLTVGEKPFFGESSYILRSGNSGMRDADYQVVFSNRDYDTYLMDGVPAEKLYILSHPLARKTRSFFEKAYFSKSRKNKKDKNIVGVMLSSDVELGFRRKDLSLISVEVREKDWLEVIKLINRILQGWIIYIKPHPATKDINEIKEKFESISENIKVVDSQEAADKYIEIGDIIIGLPLSASTVLFAASLQYPQKPILSLDFHQELLGDTYKDLEGIEYVDTKERLIDILEKINDNKYQKEYIAPKRKELELKEFSSTIEALEFFIKKQN